MVRLLQGVGAIGCIKAKFAHPSKHIRAKYPNNLRDVTIVDRKVVRLEQKLVSQHQQLCIVFMHGDFEGLELHTIWKHFVVTQQGDNELLFDAQTTEQQQEAETAAGGSTRMSGSEWAPWKQQQRVSLIAPSGCGQ
ncbi:hypothetical protein ACA910_013965 [Epithemia clementina (nom. ined.)]